MFQSDSALNTKQLQLNFVWHIMCMCRQQSKHQAHSLKTVPSVNQIDALQGNKKDA